ncbi:MAG: Protease Do [candidate division TM6 bacterium GW2011_GWF2_32_72]|nr:MAG: Protease Do [candidate division TM6 bacterium GW2011_GWF2_32_72]
MLKVIRGFFYTILLGVLSFSCYKLYKEQAQLKEHLNCVQMQRYEALPAEKIVERVVTDSSKSWAVVQSKIKDSVVQLFVQVAQIDILQPYKAPNQGMAFGSGFFINADGDIITNAHVVNESKAIWIQIPSLGKTMIDVEVVGVSPERDLALLRLKEDGKKTVLNELGQIPFLDIGNSDSVHRADDVLAVGYPLGQQSLKSTSGVISGREHIDGHYLIQMSAPINPGSSGGPVLNLSGEVVGIASSGIVGGGAQNVGYIIPINELRLVLDDLRTTRLLRKPFLGVLFNNGSEALTEYLGNPEPGGCYVVDIFEGSPLHKAGIKCGDMIYEIDGLQLDLYGEMNVAWCEDKISIMDYVSRLKLGQALKIVVYRKGQRVNLDIKFDLAEETPVRAKFPGYESLNYSVIAGMVIQPLNLNIVGALINNVNSLVKYAEFKNQLKPALVVTHVLQNSQAQRSRTIAPGAILAEINGKEVTTLEELENAIAAGKNSKYLTMETSDKIFVAFPMSKVLDDEPRLSVDNKYQVSKNIKLLLNEKFDKEIKA